MREFCSSLSCNSKTFLELGSQVPPLFAGLAMNDAQEETDYMEGEVMGREEKLERVRRKK